MKKICKFCKFVKKEGPRRGSFNYLHIFSFNDVFQIKLFIFKLADAGVIFFANPRKSIYNANNYITG